MLGSFRTKTYLISSVTATLFVILGFGVIPTAQAQSINISPAAGSYTAGQTFSVRVLASSPSESINAVSGTISFPKDKLQVLSVSKTGSAMSLWVQDPSFSNSAGTVDFAGVILNPGFMGDSATVVTVNFRALVQGQADMSISNGSLLANDGAGTNILKTVGTASYKLEKAVPTKTVETPVINKSTTTPAATLAEPRSIAAPKITDYTKQVKGIEPVYVSGSTEPNFTVRLYVLDSDGHPVKVAETISLPNGSFKLTWKPSSDDATSVAGVGIHSMVVYAIGSMGLATPPSEKMQILIDKAPVFVVGQTFLNILLIAVPIIILLVIILLLILHALKKSTSFKAEIYREMQQTESLVHKAFDKVRDDLEKYIDVLEKANHSRDLTDEEKKLAKMLRQSLNSAEKAIEGDVTRLEKRVRRRS